MTHKLEEMKDNASLKDISNAKKDLMEVFMAELHSKGAQQIDTEEAGAVIDMIKDLAEAEKCCMEACYYEKMIKSMEEDEESEADRMGYNNRRYASGRYAPKGRGTVMGYSPIRMDKRWDDTDMYDRDKDGQRMGYTDVEDDEDRDPRYGKSYNEYKKARRHYSETKAASDKQMMEDRGMKHVNETIGTFKEMWHDADPNMRKRMKSDLSALVNEMNV